jgi:hypothetical protein
MKQVKIANVLLEDTRQFFMVPQLYVRSNAPVSGKGDSWLLDGPGTFDFTTFFNALSVQKYDRYTAASSYTLHLELNGNVIGLYQTYAKAFDYFSHALEQNFAPEGEGWNVIDLPIQYDKSDVVCGFLIEAAGPVKIRNSYYTASVPDDCVRDVELALSTTTFKKESYITHNIELVREKVLGSTDDIADHFRMFVIDNGSTLDAKELSGDGVTVFPNRNVGGSGGFAYGMIKALEAGDVTNILLMDDDVEVSPESIKRTYQLLRIVNDEYKEAFISGAMMNHDDPDVHWEDIGYMTEKGIYRPYKPMLHMSVLHDCIVSESFHPATEVYGDLKQKYAAWWYCCIPISMIKKNGMPLPFFVRFDDAEYGLRCKPKFITLNGICIWHDAFNMRYNAGVERYQTVRNGILGQAITKVAPATDFLNEITNNIRTELVKFNYEDAELVCQGFEDFLKGSELFMQKDFSEMAFMAANKAKERQIPLDKLKKTALDELGIDIDRLCDDDVTRDIPLGGHEHGKVFNVYHTQLFERTLNGQLFGDLKPFMGPVQIIEGVGWSSQPGKLYGTDTLLVINVQSKTGIIRHRDNERCREIWKRFNDDVAEYKKNRAKIEDSYAACRDTITSVSFWKDYLGLD